MRIHGPSVPTAHNFGLIIHQMKYFYKSMYEPVSTCHKMEEGISYGRLKTSHVSRYRGTHKEGWAWGPAKRKKQLVGPTTSKKEAKYGPLITCWVTTPTKLGPTIWTTLMGPRATTLTCWPTTMWALFTLSKHKTQSGVVGGPFHTCITQVSRAIFLLSRKGPHSSNGSHQNHIHFHHLCVGPSFFH